jgi:hypothetical protein
MCGCGSGSPLTGRRAVPENKIRLGGCMGFQNEAWTRSPGLRPDRNGMGPIRGSLVLLALAAVLVVGAAACGTASNDPTPGGPQPSGPPPTSTSQRTLTSTPTPTQPPPSPAAPAPAQTTSPPSAPAPAPPAPSQAQPASCYPLSDEGTCYEPGEFCRDDDHGMTGVAGDGEAIECENNDGWRWEPLS